MFYFETLSILFGLTLNSITICWKRLAAANKLSIFVGVFCVLLGLVWFYTFHIFISTTTKEETKEFNQNVDWKKAKSVYDFTVKDIKGNNVGLKKFKGHVLLLVNVASECGLTDENYEELVDLDQKYRDSKGLRILAFPCNQFEEQEPGTNEEICKFAEKKGATFDFFDKVEVNGINAHPLWKYLKSKKGKTDIEWNFAKFIVDKNGKVVRRYHPEVSPHEIVETLEEYW